MCAFLVLYNAERQNMHITILQYFIRIVHLEGSVTFCINFLTIITA